MLWGIGAPSYWKDEADTVSAVSRSLPQLVRLLGHVDAVHGLYYLLLWPVARLLGTGEIATRLPSALAMAAAALGVAAIARRLASRRAALASGLVFAALPAVTAQGHDARPYALVAAAAVLASYLLTVAAREPRPRRFAAYGASLAVAGYLHLFALLLVLAHAVALAAWYRGRPATGPSALVPGTGPAAAHTGTANAGTAPVGTANGGTAPAVVARRWVMSVTAAIAAVVPLAFAGWTQRGQISWISRPGWHAIWVLTTAFGGGAACSVLIGLLAVAGPAPGRLRGPLRWLLPPRPPRAGRAGLTWLAAPWLLLPPASLLIISQFSAVYYFLYVVFCLPAVALLAGTGLAALSRPARAAAAAAIVALVLPAQLALRVPGSGSALREAASVLATHERPGDAIVYPNSGIPPWYLAYPHGFGQLQDIGMAQTGMNSGRLYGVRVTPQVLAQRECGVHRIWVVEMSPLWSPPASALVPGFRLVGEWKPGAGAMRLWLYRRSGQRCVPVLGQPAGPGAAARFVPGNGR